MHVVCDIYDDFNDYNQNLVDVFVMMYVMMYVSMLI
jgi:hypothetical protein